MFTTLIVEDNVLSRQFLNDRLRERFPAMNIDEAEEKEEVQRKVQTLTPDLIFMDIQLRSASGLDLTKQIKASHPKIIIIIFTNHDLPEYRETAAQCGADYFFSKGSSNIEEILKVVKSIVADRGHEADCPAK